MHTFIGQYGTRILHNGDYSGIAKLLVDDIQLEVEVADLLEFVAEYIRSQQIGKLEQMSTEELLKL